MGGLSRWGCAVSLLIGCYCWARPVAVANFNGSVGYGIAPDEELMDGTNSYATDPDEYIAGFDWDFGDGTPHSSAGWVRHTYQVPGHFVARLTVTGSRGDQDSATLQVQVDGNVTRWVRLLEESPSDLQSSTTDDRIVLFGSSLRKFSLNGSLEWERPQEPEHALYGGPIVPATGEIYAEQPRNITYPQLVLVRFNPEGLDPVDIRSASDFVSIVAVVDDAGNRVIESSSRGGSAVEYEGLDGTRWEISSPVLRAFWVNGAAFDPRDNLAVVAEIREAITIQGFDFQPGFTLFKVNGSGQILWVHQLPGVFQRGGVAIGVSAIGTFVVAPTFNTPFRWAGQNLEPSPSGTTYLLVAEGVDGEERFARQLDDIRGAWVAVDRVGQVATAGPAINCSGTVVYKYNLAGDFLWRRDLTDRSCNGEVRLGGLGISSHNVILSGGFRGTVDFGNGPETSQVSRHFLLNLGP